MRLFGTPTGTRMRLHSRGAFRKGPRRQPKPEAKPYTPEELRRLIKTAPAPKPPSFVSRVLSFLRRKIV